MIIQIHDILGEFTEYLQNVRFVDKPEERVNHADGLRIVLSDNIDAVIQISKLTRTYRNAYLDQFWSRMPNILAFAANILIEKTFTVVYGIATLGCISEKTKELIINIAYMYERYCTYKCINIENEKTTIYTKHTDFQMVILKNTILSKIENNLVPICPVCPRSCLSQGPICVCPQRSESRANINLIYEICVHMSNAFG